MKQIITLILLTLASLLPAQVKPMQSAVDTLAFEPRPWRAAWMTGGINLGIWSFNRYITKEEWAKVTPTTFTKNMVRGFRWDSDGLNTNMFAHPYHGGLYYNAARSNGMSYWQSIPYTILGSATWELLAETEPASINDFWATSIGGVAFGEITHRLSYRIIDQSSRGWERVGREVAAGIINPVGMLSRLVNGELFGVAPRGYHRPYLDDAITLKVGVGGNYLAESCRPKIGGGGAVIDLVIRYNDPFELNEKAPYDYFRLDLSINPVGTQPIVGRVDILALLAGRSKTIDERRRLVVGAFQHLCYHDSNSPSKESNQTPFKLASAASFGGGILYNRQNRSKNVDLRIGGHLNAILLGGSASDYRQIGERDYNFGSGFSTLFHSELQFSKLATFQLNIENYLLYTWKGYNPKGNYDNLPPELYNVQGDKSRTLFTLINPRIEIQLNRNFTLQANGFLYLRHTNYWHLPDVFYNTFETKGSLIYRM